jgi:hypothetical protein
MKEAMAPMFMENPGESSANPVIAAVEQARDALLAALGGLSFGSLGDEEALTMLLALESVGRVVDGARVLSTTDVLRRSEYFDASVAKTAAAKTAAAKTAQQTEIEVAGAVSLARRLGCRSGLVLVSTWPGSPAPRFGRGRAWARMRVSGCCSAGP